MLSNRNWFSFYSSSLEWAYSVSVLCSDGSSFPSCWTGLTRVLRLRIELKFSALEYLWLLLQVELLFFSYTSLLYTLLNCCVFPHTRASEHHGRLCQSSTKLQKCCLMFLTHFRVKCWGVFQHCPPGHLVIHLTSCFLLFFFPFLLLTVPHHCCKQKECTSPSKVCLGVCPCKL